MTEFIEYDGQRWYPFKRKFPYYRNREGYLLHRYKWEKEVGEIPDGYILHHIDENPKNNDICNLKCMSHQEHSDTHCREVSVVTRLAASLWHKSTDGRNWHREQAKRVIKLRKWEWDCRHCSKHVIRDGTVSPGEFCGNNCKSAWRRAAGIDNIDKKCVICETGYVANRYARVSTCSRVCGGKLMRLKRNGIQPDGSRL